MASRAWKVILLFGALFIFLSGCGGPDLEPAQERSIISLEAHFLTESPDEINFPVKILFAIDCSLSMGDFELGQEVGSDPHFQRIDAVRDFINEYNDNDNVQFEVMLWSSNVFDATRNDDGFRGFTKSTSELNRVLDGAYVDTTTDYLGTLDTINADIQRDIQRDIDESNEGDRIRTQYIVVFLSDGLSNAQGTEQSPVLIQRSVEDIVEMVEDNGVGSFNFHTFLLLGMFGTNDAARTRAEENLQGMADVGNGQFRLFDNAESIDFINVVDMRLTVEYKVIYEVAFNYNVRPGRDLVHVDSDGDGLTDEEEITHPSYPSNPFLKDTDGDGMSDFFEMKVSSPGHFLNPNLPDSPCVIPDGISSPDSDQDGLTDCEEFVKGTNRYIVDSDGDGIPDGIEFLTGINPLNSVTTNDSDIDGVVDWLEVQRHTNVTSNDKKIRDSYAYDYDKIDKGLIQIDQGTEMESYVRQYQFNVKNIDLMQTAPHITENGRYMNEGDNLIRFYIAQVPEDRPDMSPLFRMAEIRVNTAQAGSKIVLTPGDFTLIQ